MQDFAHIHRMLPRWSAVAALALLVVPFAPTRAGVATPGAFVDVSASSGIDITINGTDRGDWGYGSAWFDYDNDGDLDVFVASENGSPAWLFAQDDTGHFTDVAAAAGVADTRNGRGVKPADYDNDGDTDFFLGNDAGPNRLYRNNGDGTFTNVADSALAAGGPTFGAAWGDFDSDGWLDLYVVNRRAANQFFHNRGDGTFSEEAAALGINDALAGYEAVWFDYDNDGDQDLYLSQDKLGGNRLWRNEGGVSFVDVSAASGTNASINSMGVALGDYDNDGDIDMYITNTTCASLCSEVGNVFYRNNGNGTFTNVATSLGMRVDKYGWGTAFFDHDNDGDLDLYVVNWSADPTNPSLTEQARNSLFRNNGNGTFFEAAAAMGADDIGSGYGLSLADYNNDGYVDMLITNNLWPSVFYENTPGVNRWLKVKTVGTLSNRDGIGARVRAVTGNVRRIRDVYSGTSYLCHNSLEVEFGLGSAFTIDSLSVCWPSGTVDLLLDVASNQTLTVIEGTTTPLVVTMLDAQAGAGGVRLYWESSRDAGVEGYRVYRAPAGTTNETLLNGDALVTAKTYFDGGVQAGESYAYRVEGVETGGGVVSSDPMTVDVPFASLRLAQNYPNPFNPATTIEFALPERADVTLAVYDGAGRRVRLLTSGPHDPGPYTVSWDGTNDRGVSAVSGVYFCRLETPSETLTRKMTLVR